MHLAAGHARCGAVARRLPQGVPLSAVVRCGRSVWALTGLGAALSLALSVWGARWAKRVLQEEREREAAEAEEAGAEEEEAGAAQP